MQNTSKKNNLHFRMLNICIQYISAMAQKLGCQKAHKKKGHVYSHVVVECITNLCFGPLCFESWPYYDHESACGILQPATLDHLFDVDKCKSQSVRLTQ